MIFKKRDWQDEYDEGYADGDDRRKASSSTVVIIRQAAILVVIGGLFLGAVGLVAGQTMFEKTATALAMPCGLLWLGLLVQVYFCLLWRQGWPAIAGLICWLGLTVFGNAFVANWLAAQLEQPYVELTPFEDEPFEVVFLLGGGTNTSITGQAQAAASGDRVLTAARLFHAGKIERIICTGTRPRKTRQSDMHPYEEATQILLDLRVPATAVSQMPGINTSEEMRNAAALIKEQALQDRRIGILTSAWHLNRAMRLAKANGFRAEPIPANFLSHPFAPTPHLLIPSGHNMAKTKNALKELLAGLVGR